MLFRSLAHQVAIAPMAGLATAAVHQVPIAAIGVVASTTERARQVSIAPVSVVEG